MRQRIATDGAPGALGPYSQAIATEGLVFCSGQVGLDPASGALVQGGIAEQAERVFRNLGAVLEAAGSDFGSVLKTTCYLVDMADFAEFNAVYAERVPPPHPARVCVAVAALPGNARVEVTGVAVK